MCGVADHCTKGMYGTVIINYRSVAEEVEHKPGTKIAGIVIGALIGGAFLAVGI